MNTQPDVDDYGGRRLLATPETAAMLGVAERTLIVWRQRGQGPPFIRLAPRAVRYRLADADRWVAERERRSTSDTGPAGDDATV